MYLQDALKVGPGRFVIQGLIGTSESYGEAIRYLKEAYNCPRLVQAEHICNIVDKVVERNNSNKELRRVYNVATQHY